MKYTYAAVFTPLSSGEFDVTVPDLPGCRTCGKNLADAIFMAEDAVSMWLCDAESKAEKIPPANEPPSIEPMKFVHYVTTDTDEYRKKYDN